MSWEEIRVSHVRPTALERSGVELGVVSDRAGVRLRVVLGDDVLSSMGWAVGQYVAALRGRNADAGMIALTATDVGGLRVRRATRNGRMVVVESRSLADVLGLGSVHDSRRVPHNRAKLALADGVELDALVIALPGWAQPKPQQHGNGGAKAVRA